MNDKELEMFQMVLDQSKNNLEIIKSLENKINKLDSKLNALTYKHALINAIEQKQQEIEVLKSNLKDLDYEY